MFAFRPRVIVVLLLRGLGLVKTVKFKNHNYIGDPINAVKLFNDLEADELVFLDITATKEKRQMPLGFIEKIAHEANMPFSVGGGLDSIQSIQNALKSGAEKVVLNTAVFGNANLVKESSNEFGSSTIVVSMDVKKDFFGKERVYVDCGKTKVKGSVLDWAKKMEDLGAGELIVTSIQHEGLMEGYHYDLIKSVSEIVSIPVIANGGAGSLEDLKKATEYSFASAVAAGSFFVYQGPRRGVLINYPKSEKLNNLFFLENNH